MASYDTLTLSSQTAPVNLMHLQSTESDSMANPFPHEIDFTGEGMFSDVNGGDLSVLPFTPSYELDGFQNPFDDPLSYHNTGLFEPFLESNLGSTDSAPVDLDNKLLGFGAPVHKLPVLDATGQTWPRMTAELNGMFCVAEDVFEGDNQGRPLELTCYRRNLFQISGTITLSRTTGHILVDQCRRAQIYDLTATLSATESIEGKSTDIISVPWKTGAAGGSVAAEEKTGAAPASIPIDLTSNQETDPVFVSIPIAWGRLQFKYATANNGRRKGLQQHYQIQITLMARLENDGQLIKLAEIQSNPIVVRGRSPKNFDSSKDVPLSERKSESGSRARTGSIVASTPQWIEPALPQGSHGYYPQKTFQQPLDSPTWTSQPTLSVNTEPRAKKPSSASPMAQRRRPPVPQPTWKTEPQEYPMPPRAPTGLSLVDDDPISISSGSTTSPNLSEKKVGRGTVTSPPETDDQLYEYFPLSLDDWMPPVDAIYRPHVVHHLRTLPPAEAKASHVRGKPKRYFSQTSDD